ncbi:hypothetical protein Val02_65800 [Virgisporangium aliadipatigenens]|uniref:Uncharacterized protein n=1 Tax=Virgisporangium aliadipatigenens TaxID=741659 RepID=A0A8J3YQ96_9ACTN|nr:hypothetical protein [Virgisporangium aliadipatigenens]GIJ49694.1 hypothetical protein Val02_65800 [Virgisporangium aliadipatigenens]
MSEYKDAGTVVDITALEGVGEWVKQLNQFIMDNIHTELTSSMMTQGTQTDIFGGFPEAGKVGGKAHTFAEQGAESVKNMTESLSDFADATAKIVEQYKTTEARNAANVADILRLLSSGGDDTPATSATSVPGSDAGSTEGGYGG